MLWDRIRKIINTCILLIAVTSSANCTATQDVPCADKAQQFWKTFRQAAMEANSPALAKMTHFPLEIRGTLDDSQSRQISKEDFNKILPELLETDPGLKAEPTSMKKYIQYIETIPNTACNQYGNQFRVGSWVFVLQDGNWLLMKAFIEG